MLVLVLVLDLKPAACMILFIIAPRAPLKDAPLNALLSAIAFVTASLLGLWPDVM